MALRFGIPRRIKELDIYINIIKDQELFPANEVFKVQYVILKKEGLGKSKHKPSIIKEDKETLSKKCFQYKYAKKTTKKEFF